VIRLSDTIDAYAQPVPAKQVLLSVLEPAVKRVPYLLQSLAMIPGAFLRGLKSLSFFIYEAMP
jgi:hypothetical protein